MMQYSNLSWSSTVCQYIVGYCLSYFIPFNCFVVALESLKCLSNVTLKNESSAVACG